MDIVFRGKFNLGFGGVQLGDGIGLVEGVLVRMERWVWC